MAAIRAIDLALMSLFDLERPGRTCGNSRAYFVIVSGAGVDHEFTVFDFEHLRQCLHAIAGMYTNILVPGHLNCHRPLLPNTASRGCVMQVLL